MSKPHLEVDLSRGFAYYSPPSLPPPTPAGGAVVGRPPSEGFPFKRKLAHRKNPLASVRVRPDPHYSRPSKSF